MPLPDDATPFERALAEEPERTPEEREAINRQRAEFERACGQFARCFSTPAGEFVLDYLRKRYIWRSGLSDSCDPHYALASAAARAVVLEVMQMVEAGGGRGGESELGGKQ